MRERDLARRAARAARRAGRSSRRSPGAPLAAQRQTCRARKAGSPFGERLIEQLEVHASYGGRPPMRLAKYLAHAGVASRRASEAIIADGRVTVDGEVVTDPARDVDDARAVKVDGKPRQRTAGHARRLPASTSPRASSRRRRTRRTAGPWSRSCRAAERLYPVGRLDFDTTGPDPADQRRRPRAPAHPPVVRGPAHLPRAGRQLAGQRAGAAARCATASSSRTG